LNSISCRGYIEVIKLLFAKGVKADRTNCKSGRTALSYAASSGHESITRLLLTIEHVDKSSKDTIGQIPLSYTVRNGHKMIVKLLLD